MKICPHSVADEDCKLIVIGIFFLTAWLTAVGHALGVL